MEVTTYLLVVLGTLFAYLYWKLRETYRFWEKRGVKGPELVASLLDNAKTFLMMESGAEMAARLYKAFPGQRMIGNYSVFRPVVLLRDPELIERVLVKDFGSFTDLGFDVNEESNPLEASLFTMKGNRWRAMRNKMSPVFTTGKLRQMTPYMVEAYQRTSNQVKAGDDFELRDFFATYATIVIGSCVFGIDTEKMSKRDSEFRRMNLRMFTMSKGQLVKLLLVTAFPAIGKKLGFGFFPREALLYFEKIIVETMKRRREDPTLKRNDFIQTLLQLRDKGSVEYQTRDAEDDYLHSEEHSTKETVEITDSLIVAQAITFLTSGNEALSLAMMYFCLELAKSPRVQTRLRKEIEEKIKEREGVVDYETIKSMTYLDQCFQETMRMYPIAQILTRESTRATVLDGVDLEPGTQVWVPVLGLQGDPDFYPDPEVFDPDRFAAGRPTTPYTYLPFGEGPRVCIGMRFAQLDMKIGLALTVRDFEIGLSPKTQLPLRYSPLSFMLTPKQKVLFKMTRLASRE